MPDTTFDVDFVVVGSGFGGSVAALRLAEKGYRVLVVEAGRRWRPDQFPATNWESRSITWAPGLGLYGLQSLELLRHTLVARGVGVGGGSLIYGNTLFVPREPFFATPVIQELGGHAALLPHYERAQQMMGVVANPRLFEPDHLLRETAAEYGRDDTFTPSPVGVFFGEPEQTVPDPYFGGDGPHRTGCTFCGGCFTGCRVGAKNSLDLNYLYLAERLGARILPETQVTSIRPLSSDGGDGYEVSTRQSTRRRRRQRQTITARGVVVAAGVMGTLRLLLAGRQRGDLPRLSDRLGDLVRTNSETILAVRTRGSDIDFSLGLSASSSVFPDEHTQIQGDRYGAGSDFLALLSNLLVDGGGALKRPLRFAGTLARHPFRFVNALRPSGFARQTMILVVMQDHDNCLRIVRRRRWFWPFARGLASEAGSGPTAPTSIPIANDFARRLAARTGGVPLGSLTEVLLNAPVTAHILGGCVMAGSPEHGVVDLEQRVFGYRNLYVCDGSVIPTNLGVNPALSILAFSERAMSLIPAA
jgi:cholesterol oxidase